MTGHRQANAVRVPTARGRQRASRHSQFATAIRVSLNNPRNSGTLASDVAARLLRVHFTRQARSEEQAPCEERSPLRTRRRGRASQSTEVKRRGPRIIQHQELTAYFT